MILMQFFTNSLALSLVVAAFGDELNATAAHDASSEHVAVELLLCRELEDVEGVLGVHQLFVIIDGLDLHLALGDVDVVEGISADAALCTKTSFTDAFTKGLLQLVEDVVGPLHSLLLRDTGLLQQVAHNVTASQLSGS